MQAIGWPLYFFLMILINDKLSTNVSLFAQSYGLILIIIVFNTGALAIYSFLRIRFFMRNILIVAVTLIGVTVFLYFAVHVLFPIFSPSNAPSPDSPSPREDFFWRMLERYFNMAFIIGVAYLWIFSGYNKEQYDKENALRIQNDRTRKKYQLLFLSGQIDSHFIFNTLTLIQAKCAELQLEVTSVIQQFTNLLQYKFKDIDQVEILAEIDSEVNIVQQYISLQSARFSDCYIDFVVKESYYNTLKIPPCILLTIIENVFKHGIYRDPKRPAVAMLHLTEETIYFYCSNSFKKGQPKQPSTGLGLKNIRERLELIYPGNYSFDSWEVEDRFYVELKINQVN